MTRDKQYWHPKFLEYMEKIAKHENYSDMPEKFKVNGEIRWVVSGNSKIGEQRAEWWDEKKNNLKFKDRAEVARYIHPSELDGQKVCQICGKSLNINYVYPTKNTLTKLNKITNNITIDSRFQMTICEIFDVLLIKVGNEVFEEFKKIFGVPENIGRNKEGIISYILSHSKTKLSPGVMSNAPDRFDGFHSYNGCCRSEKDKGRSKSNLNRYTQDRRAYENWADGDWNLSNRLMGEYKNYPPSKCPACGRTEKISADHIGPISLGFSHRPKFNPLCKSCNSSKNNRMALEDVKILIEDEKNGETVISWHSKMLWDVLKFKVKNDDDAIKLSKIMRNYLHNILTILAYLHEKGYDDFLKWFLTPGYSFYDYRFKNFNPFKLEDLKIEKNPLTNKNKIKNAERYIRISLESLEQYSEKDNRKVKLTKNKKIMELIKELVENLENNSSKKLLDKTMDKIIVELTQEHIKEF
ncbi:MAG: hypothetical protein ACRCVG_00535 [Methanobacteriaceae archaeon]